jgi:hypothetical protein
LLSKAHYAEGMTKKPSLAERVKKQEPKRQRESCIAMANAMLDAIAKGEVTHVAPQDNSSFQFRIEGFSFPNDERGERKLAGVAAFLEHALVGQLEYSPQPDIHVEIAEKADGQLCLQVSDFDEKTLKLRVVKDVIKKTTQGIFKGISASQAQNWGLKATDQLPDPHWIGPFGPQVFPHVGHFIEALCLFHMPADQEMNFVPETFSDGSVA